MQWQPPPRESSRASLRCIDSSLRLRSTYKLFQSLYMPCFLRPPYSSCCIHEQMGKHWTINIYQIRTGELLREELMHKTIQQQFLLLLLCRCEGLNTKRSNTRKWEARIKNLSCICSVMQTSYWCQFPLENSWNILYIACGQDGSSSF